MPKEFMSEASFFSLCREIKGLQSGFSTLSQVNLTRFGYNKEQDCGESAMNLKSYLNYRCHSIQSLGMDAGDWRGCFNVILVHVRGALGVTELDQVKQYSRLQGTHFHDCCDRNVKEMLYLFHLYGDYSLGFSLKKFHLHSTDDDMEAFNEALALPLMFSPSDWEPVKKKAFDFPCGYYRFISQQLRFIMQGKLSARKNLFYAHHFLRNQYDLCDLIMEKIVSFLNADDYHDQELHGESRPYAWLK